MHCFQCNNARQAGPYGSGTVYCGVCDTPDRRSGETGRRAGLKIGSRRSCGLGFSRSTTEIRARFGFDLWAVSDRDGPFRAQRFKILSSGAVGRRLTVAEPRSRKIALGYVHNLSKRTAVYTTVARVRNDGGAAASAVPGAAGNPSVNSNSTGFDLGVRHSF